MSSPSPFADDWHDAQEAHFTHISRVGDAEAREKARAALTQAGYSDAQISELYVEATMHQDDLADDFLPDMSMIERLREVQHPNDCLCPSCRKK